MAPTFNLIDEPWIPCLPIGGPGTTHVGIRDALLRASEFARIYSESPLVTVSLHRLLLAVLYRACGPSSIGEWRELWRGGIPSDKVEAYLTRWHDRFDLFDESHPFYQVAELQTGSGTAEKWTDSETAVIRLANEAPDKNQPVLFDHRTYTEMSPCRASAAARWLIASQSYGICSSNSSNLRLGKQIIATPGCKDGLGVGGLSVWLSGKCLRETLLLNLVPYAGDRDKAAWEMDDSLARCQASWKSPKQVAGPAERFTWQSRLIRLLPRDETGRMVRAVYFTQGCVAADDQAVDPMRPYQRGGQDKPWTSVKLSRHKAAWRDAHALLAHTAARFKPPEAVAFVAERILDETIASDTDCVINAVGLAKGDKPAKQMLWRHDRFITPAALLRDHDLIERLSGAINDAELVGNQLNTAARSLCMRFLASDGISPNPKDVTSLADSIDPRRAYWPRMEQHFHVLLAELPKNSEEALSRWRKAIEREANHAYQESSAQLGQSPKAIRARAQTYANLSP